MMKHTPAPWYVFGWDDPAGTPLRIRTANRPSGSDPRTIALAQPQNTQDELEANARLIAACPDMADYIRRHAAAGDEGARQLVETFDAPEKITR